MCIMYISLNYMLNAYVLQAEWCASFYMHINYCLMLWIFTELAIYFPHPLVLAQAYEEKVVELDFYSPVTIPGG